MQDIANIAASSNDVSASFDRIWENFNRRLLTGIPYVAIKLIDGSEGAKQFAEFCKHYISPLLKVVLQAV